MIIKPELYYEGSDNLTKTKIYELYIYKKINKYRYLSQSFIHYQFFKFSGEFRFFCLQVWRYVERCGQHNKKLGDSDSVSPKKKMTTTVPRTHPQEKLNLLLALWSQGVVHFDWVFHCMGGPMNLLRTQVDWRKLGMDFGFCFFARFSQDFYHCKNFNFSHDKTSWNTHSVWALWHLTRCSFALYTNIYNRPTS